MGVLASKLTGRRYRLVAALARGGMGEVFVGQEVGAKARAGAPLVAIKTLRREGASDDTALNRFLDEARLSARLDHPNIARLLDFGEAAGRPFAIFELLEGADLGDCLDRLIDRELTTPPEVAVAIGIEACQGLEHAHTLEKDGEPLQVVHRDLSPSNIFVTRDGHAKVLDFGAAGGKDRLTRTATGLIIGKLEYMPPEQVRGQPLDARSDVFALGLCLHESLALQRPYACADEHEQIRLIYNAEVPELRELRPQLPAALYAALQKATSADPAQRYPSAQAFSRALEPILRKLTRDPVEKVLARFYRSCFGAERDQLRAARLKELLARPVVDADQFQWAAPSLKDEPGTIELGTSDLEVVGTPQLADDDPPTFAETDGVDDDEALEPAPARKKASPRAPSTPAPAQPPRYLGYAVIAGVVLLALLAGLVIGRLGANLGH